MTEWRKADVPVFDTYEEACEAARAEQEIFKEKVAEAMHLMAAKLTEEWADWLPPGCVVAFKEVDVP